MELDIARHDAVVQSARSLKQLFVGTGESFATVVENVMIEFGLKVVRGPSHRADLIGFDGTRIAGIEVKGLEGSARETNLRQTERWVADIRSALVATPEEIAADSDLKSYAEKLSELGVPSGPGAIDMPCKGIMIIGTFRKIPIGDRREPSFPDPVARTINRSAVCALSGLQLLGLYLKAKKTPSSMPEILNLLFSTDGVLNEATDWTEFLDCGL